MSAPVVSRAVVRRLRGAAERGIVPPPGAVRAYRLPWPPSVNDYWIPAFDARTGKQRLVLTHRARRYRGAVANAVLLVERVFPLPWSGKLAVTIDLVPPDDDAERLHDIDNVLKAIFDSLTKTRVWEDDSQVKKLSLDIDHPAVRPGFADVTIRPVP